LIELFQSYALNAIDSIFGPRIVHCPRYWHSVFSVHVIQNSWGNDTVQH